MQDASKLAGNDRETPDLGTASDDMSSPSRVADQILRELVNAATFGSIKVRGDPIQWGKKSS